MKPIDVLRALLYPATEPAVLVPLLFFWMLVSFALWGGVFGLFLLFLVIPAVFRFQMIVLEARARGVTPDTPDSEFFNWFGNAWTLFPVPVVLLLAWITIAVAQQFGTAAAIVPVVIASALFPASIAVLAITHSPLQSLNPAAIGRLLDRCGRTFWLATVYLVISAWISAQALMLPVIWFCLANLLLSFSFFSLVGSLIEPYGLIAEVDIPEPLEKSADELGLELQKSREDALGHAYGFISRDNRDGGFKHLFDWIEQDPDPVGAWAWFLEQMLRWENTSAALFFAQHYLHDQLRHGEQAPAVKLIMRCRLFDERFRPLSDDIAAAIAAADAVGNDELAQILRRN